MTENEAIEKIKYRMHTAEHVAGECGMEDLEMAVNALEEIQRWHTSEVNPNIKNVFANMSTQICHNCDHKDEYIEELEAEIEQYRKIEKELKEHYHANVDIPLLMHHFIETVFEGEKHEGFCLLTNEDAKAWDEYKSIGTPEECRAAVEKQTARKVTTNHSWTHYHFFCPVCNMEVNDMKYCLNCGQKLDWGDEE